jgi:hypothetical protein
MITAGSTLDFALRGQTQAAQFQIVFNEAMLAGEAATYISQTLELIDINVTATGTVLTGTLPWEYTARVRVRTRVAHAQASDVGSIIANAFFRASGNMPSIAQGVAVPASQAGSPFPRGIELPEFGWSTALVVVGVAVLVLAWKF